MSQAATDPAGASPRPQEAPTRAPAPEGASDPVEPSLWALAWPWLAQERRALAVGAGYLALSGLAAGFIPQAIRVASNALGAGDAGRAMRASLAVAGLAAVGAWVRVASRIKLFNVGREVEFDLRAKMLANLHTLGPSFYQRMSPGEIMSRATNDLAQVRLLIGFGILNLFNTLFAYLVNIPLMVSRSPKLAVLSLLPFPVFLAITRRFGRAMFARSKEAQESLGALSDIAQRALGAMRVVRAYNLEGAELQRFSDAADKALEANLALARLRGLMFPILGAGAAVASLVVIWVGSGMIIAREGFSVGDILAFQVHLGLVAWPTIALGYMLSIVQRGKVSMARVQALLDARPDIDDALALPVDAASLRGALSVRGLRFAVDGRALLDGVSFELPAGRSLAVVGKTGAGKSVLVKLLARMLQTPAGAVFLDGHDVTRLPLATLRGTVGMAQQEPFLFSSTVARNVAFGALDPDAPEVKEAIARCLGEAQMTDEIKRMPDGEYTIVGERGVQLSGGQKQRVALARALMTSPKVLVLDDPLSAVDARTEAGILDAIDRAAAGRTLLLVTHRVAAARRCDEIVVLDEGRVVDRGTHDALVARGGLYARLAERQALEAELEAL